MARPSTVIAVPTFRRPERLRHLLDALARLKGLDDAMVLVADNDDAGREGVAVAGAAAANGFPAPIAIITVPQAGLTHVRNAIVEQALRYPTMRRLAMIDDDEWPGPEWLAQLLLVQRNTGAGVVAGPVEPRFVEDAPGWAMQTLVFRPEQRREGLTDMLYAANNLLVERRALEAIERPWFDPAFNLSGGEDMDFLTRLRAAGIAFAWAPSAVVYEAVGPERARKSWVLRRMWRIGITDIMAARKRRAGALARLALTVRSLALLGLRTLLLPTMAWQGERRLDIAGQWVKSAGRLYALAGGSDAIYAAPATVTASPRRGNP